MAKNRQRSTDDARGDRWRGRPVLSALVSLSIFVIPIALSIVAATITAHVLPRPRGDGSLAVWWLLVLAVPTGVLVATDRLARRALPLAVLLKMTMVFPDRAPKRLAVARKSGAPGTWPGGGGCQDRRRRRRAGGGRRADPRPGRCAQRP